MEGGWKSAHPSGQPRPVTFSRARRPPSPSRLIAQVEPTRLHFGHGSAARTADLAGPALFCGAAGPALELAVLRRGCCRPPELAGACADPAVRVVGRRCGATRRGFRRRRLRRSGPRAAGRPVVVASVTSLGVRTSSVRAAAAGGSGALAEVRQGSRSSSSVVLSRRRAARHPSCRARRPCPRLSPGLVARRAAGGLMVRGRTPCQGLARLPGGRPPASPGRSRRPAGSRAAARVSRPADGR